MYQHASVATPDSRDFPHGTLLQTYKQQKADIVGQACLQYSDESSL
jgi:hypothetical protein